MEKAEQQMQNMKNAVPNIPKTNVPNAQMPNKASLMFKAIMKMIGKAVLKFFLTNPVGILLLIILIVCLIVASQNNDEKKVDGKLDNIPYAVSATTTNQITIVKDGSGKYVYAFTDEKGNICDLETAVENAIDTLEKHNSTSLGSLGETRDSQKRMLTMMIKADLETKFPNLENSEDIGLAKTTEGNFTNKSMAFTGEEVRAVTNATTDNNTNENSTGKVTGCDGNFDVTLSSNFITDKGKMEKALVGYNENFKPYVQNFLDFQSKYKVNALFIAAIAQVETQAGTTGHAVDGCHNWGNIASTEDPLQTGYKQGDQNWAIYPDDKTGIEAIFSLIAERGNYVASGNTTMSQIFLIYNPGGAEDETNLVAEIMASMYSSAGVNSVIGGKQAGTQAGTGDIGIKETLDKDKNIKGTISIETKDKDGNASKLKYTSTQNFNKLMEKKDDKIFEYYTIKRVESGASLATKSTELVGSENEEKVWNYLVAQGLTKEGTAGIMGSFKNESGFDSQVVQGHSGETDYNTEYVKNVDSGAISESEFVNNGPGGGGFGLAQWTDPGRKKNLYDYAKSKNTSIGDLQMQLEFAVKELQESYSSIYSLLTTTSDIQAAADEVTLKYENPANAQGKLAQRGSDAKQIYDTYKNKTVSAVSNNSSNNNNKSNTNNNTNSDTKNNSNSNNSNTNNSSNNKTNSTSSDNKKKKSTGTSTIQNFDNFLFVGDSRYAGIGTKLEALGNNVSVAAVSGSTPDQWVSITSSGSGSISGNTIKLPQEASGVSVTLGVNATSQVTELEQVLTNLHARYPNATVFMNSIFHVGANYTIADKDAVNKNIDEMNSKMKSFCSSNSWARYIDITKGLYDNSGYLKEPDSEGIHLGTDNAINTFVDNIKAGIVGESSESSEDSLVGTSSYVLVLPTKVTTTVDEFTTYTYKSISAISTSSGSTSSSSKDNQNGTVENNYGKYIKNQFVGDQNHTQNVNYQDTMLAFQDALKSHSLPFDFMWVVYRVSHSDKLVKEWCDLAVKRAENENRIVITSYQDEETKMSSTATEVGDTTETSYDEKSKTAINVVYSGVKTTNTTTQTKKSKGVVTFADTWLLKYENDASNYKEYTGKSKEKITEKLDKNSDEKNIIKIIRSISDMPRTLKMGKDHIENALKDNPDASHMIDIYNYVVDVSNGKKNVEKPQALADAMSMATFDLTKFVTTTSASGSGKGGNSSSAEGDGYKTVFESNGRKYKEYKQTDGSYQNMTPYGWGGDTIAHVGCALTSVAVIATGYGVDISPADIANYCDQNSYAATNIEGLMQHYLGKTVTTEESDVKNTIIKQLKEGIPCLVRTYAYSSVGHFVCVLAINEDGTEVYVSDVGGYYEGQSRNGWLPISILDSYVSVKVIGD